MAQVERTGADYPRKRTAIACEICRARRSKCDAQRPACSKCVELEVDCVYRKPNLWDREPVTAAANAALGKVDDRLDQIQDSIRALAEQISSIARSGAGLGENIQPQSSSTFGRLIDLSPPRASAFEVQHKLYQGRAGPSSYGSLSAAQSFGHRMPNLMSFISPPSLGPFSYDSAEQFFTGEVEQGNNLFACLEDTIIINSPADFSPQTCWRLQRAFVGGFLRWMPLFDDETCLQHIQAASKCLFSNKNASSCLTLFMFAIGAMAADEPFYQEDPQQLPGFQYLALGYNIMKGMQATMGDIHHLQCRALFAVYLVFAMRPVQSWHEINRVSRECMLMLKTSWKSADAVDAELRGRVFWVAYTIENELEVCLELPSSGIRTFQEILSLPSGAVEDEGLYYFLALISLRKLLAEVIETIGFKSGHAIYVPVVAVELRNQILRWHTHLPTLLRFPLDASPLFDLRKSYLRGQYFCLSSVIYWPFVLRHVENTSSTHVESAEIAVERASVHERAKECIDSCVLHLRASEGIMMQKTLVSHSSLRAFYAITMILLVAYEPVYHVPHPENITLLIKRSLSILSLWDKVPFMREPLTRVHCFADEVGWSHGVSPGTGLLGPYT